MRAVWARRALATLVVAGAALTAGGSPALGTPALGTSASPAASPSPSTGSAPSVTGPIDLTPSGGESRAVRVNSRGDIVGSATPVPDGTWTGRLWSGHGYSAIPRGELGPHAMAINNHGDAVGCTAGGVGLIWRGGALTQVSRAGQSICFYAVNDSGQIAGTMAAGSTGASRSFLYEHGRFTDLGIPTNRGSYPVGINNRGQIVGRIIGTTTSLPVRTFVWTAGKWADVGTLGGDQSIPVAINDTGTVIGTSTLADGKKHPFSWHAGHITDLLAGTGVDDNNSYVNALNNAGDIAGTVTNRPVLWKHGKLRYLAPAGTTGEATAINARGQVAGVTRTSADEPIVFRWSAGELTSLPKVPGQNYGYAVGIDDRGRVVGNVAVDPGSLSHAVVWN